MGVDGGVDGIEVCLANDFDFEEEDEVGFEIIKLGIDFNLAGPRLPTPLFKL